MSAGQRRIPRIGTLILIAFLSSFLGFIDKATAPARHGAWLPPGGPKTLCKSVLSKGPFPRHFRGLPRPAGIDCFQPGGAHHTLARIQAGAGQLQRGPIVPGHQLARIARLRNIEGERQGKELPPTLGGIGGGWEGVTADVQKTHFAVGFGEKPLEWSSDERGWSKLHDNVFGLS